MKPVFVQNRSLIEKALRMSGEAESSRQQLDNALTQVRIGIYDELGKSTVDTIVAITPAESPSTADELRRARAEQVEHSWVRLIMLRTAPAFFMDGTASAEQEWNETGLLREQTARVNSEMSRLEAEVQSGLDWLKGEGTVSKIKASVIGQKDTSGRNIANTYPGSRTFIDRSDGEYIG